MSLTFPQRGRHPADKSCLPSLRSSFENQVQLLSTAAPMNIRALDAEVPRTIAIVMGDVFGKTADLFGIPLAAWWSDTRARVDFPLDERTRNLGIPSLDPSNVLSGLYRRSDADLVYGQVLIAWHSLYRKIDVDAPKSDCRLNFINQIVRIHTLGIETTLQDELSDIEIAARRRIADGVDNFERRGLISGDISSLTVANVFCWQVLGEAATTPSVAACAFRVGALLAAKNI